MQSIKFNNILKGIKGFKKVYRKKAAIQIMLTGDNKNEAGEMAGLVRELGFKEVQICTPLRESKVKPVSCKEINKIKEYFKGMDVKCVYDVEHKAIAVLDEKGVRKRHGVYKR
jgi:wyosine [tRNA(Phe)-imidazoG37] synthetase (radical SAM superfamily)